MDMTDEQIDELIEAAHRNAGMIQQSTVFMHLYMANYEKDPIALMQMALAILMDKPFLILAAEGTPISDKLRRIADDISFFPPGDEEGLKAATMKMLTRQVQKMEKH